LGRAHPRTEDGHIGAQTARGIDFASPSAPDPAIRLDRRNAVLQYCGMTTLTLNKRGGITLPPAIRRRMGLDRLENPLLVVEERDGGVFLHPATALPVRDIPAETIHAWIREDETAMAALRKPPRKVRCRA